MKKIFLLFFLLVCPTVCYADQPAQVNNGRYVIYQHPTFRGDQYMLDTKTGNIAESKMIRILFNGTFNK